MPILSRQTNKLLSQVNGRPHATQDDHIDALPPPPATNSTRSSDLSISLIDNQDINREPESSDDEHITLEQSKASNGFTKARQVDEVDSRFQKQPVFQPPRSSSPGSAGSKRSKASDRTSSDDDAAIFSSQNSFKKPKTSHTGNIHAQPKSRSKWQVYGRNARQSSQKRANQKDFQDARKDEGAEKAAVLPAFKKAVGADMFEFGKPDADPAFGLPKTYDDRVLDGDLDVHENHNLSPGLSSLSSAPSSPEIQEIKQLNLPAPQPYIPTVECAICGQEVDLFLKEEFENEFTRGKLLSYKWQQRFCRYHKQHEARRLWRDRGYPEIDWRGLEKGMRRHHLHLKDILSGAKPSHHRDELSDRLKDRSKTTLQAVNADGAKQGARVGYYGTRGERVM